MSSESKFRYKIVDTATLTGDTKYIDLLNDVVNSNLFSDGDPVLIWINEEDLRWLTLTYQ